jgi:phosphatidylserine decarboxylase
MTVRTQILRIFQQEDINFLLTNRIPRRSATQFIGWFSRIEQPFIRDLSIAVWRLFSNLDLAEAKKTHFRSLHDCFIRELKDGARPVDGTAGILVSPCDAIVGACGAIEGTGLYQAKGFPYTLQDLLCDRTLVEMYRNGRYVTLRLTSSMYHRFHAPHDGHIDRVNYVSGETWNVNPIALKRIERLFCKNERAVVPITLAAGGQTVTLVAVAAILVAGIRLHCIDAVLNRNYRGRNVIACDSQVRKGEELGWFEHGSTIIVFAPDGFALSKNIRDGATIRMGQPLMRVPSPSP